MAVSFDEQRNANPLKTQPALIRFYHRVFANLILHTKNSR